MTNRFKGKFKIIILSLIVIVVALISVNCIISYWNNFKLKNYKKKNKAIWIIKSSLNAIESQVFHGVDMGVRAYRSTKDKTSLGFYDFAYDKKDSIFNTLYKNIQLFDIPVSGLREVEDTVEKYMKFCTYLKSLVEQERFREFDSLLLLDKGQYYWSGYNNFRVQAFEKLDNYTQRMDKETENALEENFLIQIITILIGVPLLILMCIVIVKYEKLLNRALEEVQDKNFALEYYYDLLSHQIRAPICSLQGLINLMHTTNNRHDENEILQRIKSINNNLDTITRLTRNEVEEEVHSNGEMYQ